MGTGLSQAFFEQLGLLGGLHELSLKFRYFLFSLILSLFKPGIQLCVVFLQVVNMLQHPSSVLSVLQQGSYIQHIVQIRLDLDLQLLTLCLLQML